MKSLLLFALVGLALAQNPKPCESPEQFEAIIETHDRDRHFFMKSRFSYDGTGMRTRRIDEFTYHDEREVYDVLSLYQTKAEYFLNLKTRKCEKRTLNEPFHKIGVEEGAESHGEVYVGGEAPGTGVLVSLWEGRYREGDYYWGSFSYTDCIPVHHGFYSNRTGEESRRFYDVTKGIKDSTIFTVPKECQ